MAISLTQSARLDHSLRSTSTAPHVGPGSYEIFRKGADSETTQTLAPFSTSADRTASTIRSAAPGPGTYHNAHQNKHSKEASESSSFASRSSRFGPTRRKSNDLSPGPQSYTLSSTLRVGSSTTGSYALDRHIPVLHPAATAPSVPKQIYGRDEYVPHNVEHLSIKRMNHRGDVRDAPGPCDYSPRNSLGSTKGTRWAASKNPRAFDQRGNSKQPGPGSYSMMSTIGHGGATSAFKSTIKPSWQQDQSTVKPTPGPGEYHGLSQPRVTRKNLAKDTQFGTMVSRDSAWMERKSSNVPGPGSYIKMKDPEKEKRRELVLNNKKIHGVHNPTIFLMLKKSNQKLKLKFNN